MAISPQLRQFKSSGVYRLEFDKSQTANINVETLRLVVGHSKKGAYNTPVLVETAEDFINAFGNIDKGLEKKGMYFHRSALAALSRGPILALNLNKFTSSDTANYISPETNGSRNAVSLVTNEGNDEYTAFHDVEKFMTPSDAAFLTADSGGAFTDNNIISFVNLKNTPLTVIVKMATDVDGFELTAEEWYGVGNVPEYLHAKDYMSDFMVDVYVFKGKFNPTDMNNDAVFGSYFTSTGLEKDKLDSFANLRQVSLLAKYTGSLLPGFKDMEGRNVYIETAINAEARRTGLFCAVDEDKVLDSSGTKLDLIGHSHVNGQENQVLSYKVGTTRDATITGDIVAASESYNGTVMSVQFDETVNISTFFKKGDLVPAAEADRLARVLKVWYTVSNDIKTYNVETDVPMDQTVFDDSLSASVTTDYIKSFESAATEYLPFVLDGATIAANTITDCIGQLSGTGLASALVDKDIIDFRYIVDTFGSYDTNGLHTKSELATLAKDRQNASAILNAPTVAEFKKSTDPAFTDSDGKFDTAYIKDGGNLDKNPTSLYALPGINEGANYAFYYGPGLLVKDNGKNIIVPPAAYVSNNFIDKYTTALPWSIVAGPRRGVVGGSGVVGTEYSFDKSDRDVLEPFGINPIVFQRGVGLTILGNKTAQQSIKSALSSAHVREVLIYIQDGIADILKDYVFEFNTVQTRLEIKTLVDSFLESVKQDGGVFDFKNVMDSSNNDDEVIDNNMGIIDTYVEPVKGLEIVVHRTTVLNTGEIATGNFS